MTCRELPCAGGDEGKRAEKAEGRQVVLAASAGIDDVVGGLHRVPAGLPGAVVRVNHHLLGHERTRRPTRVARHGAAGCRAMGGGDGEVHDLGNPTGEPSQTTVWSTLMSTDLRRWVDDSLIAGRIRGLHRSGVPRLPRPHVEDARGGRTFPTRPWGPTNVP